MHWSISHLRNVSHKRWSLNDKPIELIICNSSIFPIFTEIANYLETDSGKIFWKLSFKRRRCATTNWFYSFDVCTIPLRKRRVRITRNTFSWTSGSKRPGKHQPALHSKWSPVTSLPRATIYVCTVDEIARHTRVHWKYTGRSQSQLCE